MRPVLGSGVARAAALGLRADAARALSTTALQAAAARGPRRGEPPPSVVNFRNMQRRRGGVFRANVRVPRNAHRRGSGLRDRLFRMALEVREIGEQSGDPLEAFKAAEACLHERMKEWHTQARRTRAEHDAPLESLTPQPAVAAWNQVIGLALRAGSPNGAWRVFCDMKRAHLYPTAVTYSCYFQGLAEMVRARKVDLNTSHRWLEHASALHEGLDALRIAAAAGDKSNSAFDQPVPNPARERSVEDARRDPHSLVVAYSAYLTFLFAIRRAEDARSSFDELLRLTEPHLSPFSCASFYTTYVRDVCLSALPPQQKRREILAVWTRWERDVQEAPNPARRQKLLDLVALKTLVWAFSRVAQLPDAPDRTQLLLAKYAGVRFPRAPLSPPAEPPTKWSPVSLSHPLLAGDILQLFQQYGQLNRAADVAAHLLQHAPGVFAEPRVAAASLAAFAQVGDFLGALRVVQRVSAQRGTITLPVADVSSALRTCESALDTDANAWSSSPNAWEAGMRIYALSGSVRSHPKVARAFLALTAMYCESTTDAQEAARAARKCLLALPEGAAEELGPDVRAIVAARALQAPGGLMRAEQERLLAWAKRGN